MKTMAYAIHVEHFQFDLKHYAEAYTKNKISIKKRNQVKPKCLWMRGRQTQEATDTEI